MITIKIISRWAPYRTGLVPIFYNFVFSYLFFAHEQDATQGLIISRV